MMNAQLSPQFGKLIVDREAIKQEFGEERSKKINTELDQLLVPVLVGELDSLTPKDGKKSPNALMMSPAINMLEGMGVDVDIRPEYLPSDDNDSLVKALSLRLLKGNRVMYHGAVSAKEIDNSSNSLSRLFIQSTHKFFEKVNGLISNSISLSTQQKTLKVAKAPEELYAKEVLPEKD